MTKRTRQESLDQLIAQQQTMLRTGTEWMARQAVGDAVLLLLRDGEALTRDALLARLAGMAEGRIADWQGTRSVAAKAAELVSDPPTQLPEFRSKE